MLTLVIGPPDCGKSAQAEAYVVARAAEDARIYLATMIPYGEEGTERVARHRAMRADKQFETIEMPFDVGEALRKIRAPREKTVLLECISNLVANEMFGRDEARSHPAGQLTERVLRDVKALAAGVRALVVVSNVYDRSDGSDEETWNYIRIMDAVNERLREMADEIIEVTK